MERVEVNVKTGARVTIPLTAQEIAAAQAATAVETEKSTRLAKIDEIKANALTRIIAVLPTVETFEDVEMIKAVAPAFTLSANGITAKDIYIYARTKINQAKTAPIGQVSAYDPATDPNWPA